ncbi:MAG: HAD-IIIC family phosphatase [Thalassolituus sp.]|jgi:capsule biosynthesis phosphatase|uniref:Capsule biosynthesis phosphatase n=1 Tax=Thalassolituus oleivorans MIL-1 TaxID=1298593 RepID=M5DYX1_9GAMM|nr:HAD-IIIC family phosphatase [Thalassolituus oleivorans]AHK14788.1 phosphatase IIIC [Thalassolituus oleivorans R6-15]MBQ0726845.1 HAD-IIIC family phosphatase [Thalassolituus oleivorans]MBQ0780072.1 HAD-IIIC family phosphatase [Thalassolituus oleivorans]MCA6127582.1 capsular biosynthesis protein [Thalassolituus oleivorans 4BN06-13]MDF1639463.1 HAD-IIIC family phosphatase [Thalassolituus oleivorans]|tara:strand:+ start:4805 stop:5176 length:372 start_codon:yes stop_codon:yes gene_type:complete
MKRLVFDLDNTLTVEGSGDYADVSPRMDMIEKLREYKDSGFEIIISTSRNMRTYNASVGKINANTLPVILHWLAKHKVPFDEIHVGKPWCGTEGFYIDDKSIRPSEFRNLSYDKIIQLLEKEK